MNRDKAREILTRGSPATEPLLEERACRPVERWTAASQT